MFRHGLCLVKNIGLRKKCGSIDSTPRHVFLVHMNFHKAQEERQISTLASMSFKRPSRDTWRAIHGSIATHVHSLVPRGCEMRQRCLCSDNCVSENQGSVKNEAATLPRIPVARSLRHQRHNQAKHDHVVDCGSLYVRRYRL